MPSGCKDVGMRKLKFERSNQEYVRAVNVKF